MTKPLQCMAMQLLATVVVGCQEPDIVHTYTRPAPDIAVYDDVIFSSMDGLVNYTSIDIFPQEVAVPIGIRMPDGVVVDSTELSREVFKRHVGECVISNDDGYGNYGCTGSGMNVSVENWLVRRVSISTDHAPRGAWSVEIRGKMIDLPINRGTLEEILGKPDLTREGVYPGELSSQMRSGSSESQHFGNK